MVHERANAEEGLIRPGSVVDHFRVSRRIGQGGMGEVYLARDVKLGRKVALKVVHPETLGDGGAQRRFLKEARVTARFNHPHIVTVYSVGEVGEAAYLAMEYLEGQTLGDRMREGGSSVVEGMRMGRSVAEALAEAHRHHVLHRDLKPDNVILPRDGRLRVVDFGIAVALAPPEESGDHACDDEPSISSLDLVSSRSHGTPRYMSPEQWAGEPATTSSDIWALGVILYELLAGEHPFDAPSLMGLCGKVCDPEPAPLVRGRAVPPELSALVARCLDKSPGERPPAREIATTLEGLLLGARRRAPEGTHNPFRGLLPFQERHAELFFGREAEITAFLDALRDVPVLPVVGSSGAGKSSFVKAGVIPRLREQDDWLVLSLRPGERPFHTLAFTLVDAESDEERTSPVAELIGADSRASRTERAQALADRLFEAPLLVAVVLQRLAESRRVKVLLFVDQLEELYTLAPDDEVRRRFATSLSSAADDPLGPVRVVFTLRDDFLGRVGETDEARVVLGQITMLRAPTAESLAEILTKPVELRGYAFEDPELPAEMVAAVQSGPASLPLLQFAGSRLWTLRDRERRLLLREAYHAMGGVEGALARHADRVLDALPPDQVRVAREIFLRLVSPDGTRRVLAPARLLEGLPEPSEAVLAHLTKERAILARRDLSAGDGEAKLELVHESLVTSWERLARWREESRGEIAFLAEVGQAAELWVQRGRLDEEVWRGAALQEALARAARCATLPKPIDEFLEAGERRERRRVRRRRSLWIGSVTFLALVALVFAVMFQEASQQRELARAQRIRAERQNASALREGARTALERGEMLEARAKLRGSIELLDSPMARALWWQLRDRPLLWKKALGTWINAVAFSPEGSLVAAGCGNKTIYLLDRQSSIRRTLRGHDGQVLAVAFSPDGRYLASGGHDSEVRLWDLTSDRVQVLRGHQAPVTGVAFSPDRPLLASSSCDRTIGLWSVPEGEPRGVLRGHTAEVMRVDFGPEGLLGSCGDDRTVRIWDTSAGRERKLLSGHADAVRQVKFSPDGRRVASAGLDETARIWEVDSGRELRVLRGHAGPVRGLGFSPDGATLATGGFDETIRLWDARTGEQRRVLEGHDGRVWDVAFDADGALLVSGSLDKTVRLWDLATSERQATPGAHEAAVLGLGFSPDGTRIASGSYDGTVRLWDVASGSVARVIQTPSGVVGGLDFLDVDGRLLLAAGSESGAIHLWDAATGSLRQVLQGHTQLVLSVDVGAGRLVSGSLDKTVRLWDVASGGARVLRGHESAVWGVTIRSDGEVVASGAADGTIRLWDAERGTTTQVLEGHSGRVIGVDFTPDGRGLVSAGLDRTLRLWDLDAGTSRVIGEHDAPVHWLQVSPDGRRAGTPSGDGTVRLWELDTGSSLVLRGHVDEVNTLRFSPDGQLVATSSDDGTVRLWETATGRPRWRAPILLRDPPELLTHAGWIAMDPSLRAERAGAGPHWRRALERRARQASMSPDGALLCLSTFDETLEVWEIDSDRLRFEVSRPGLERVLATDGGCLDLTRGELSFRGASGEATVLADEVGAVSIDRGDVLVASGEEMLVFDGRRLEEVEGRTLGPGVTALTRAGARVVVGYREGGIAVVTDDPEGAGHPLAFEDVPASPVVSLLAGPAETLLAGYADGTLGIWSLDNRVLMRRVQLHGPVVHLIVEGGLLYAASELGQRVVLDLEIFRRDACDLMREVWSVIPVVWEGGQATPREPPSGAGHRCAPP